MKTADFTPVDRARGRHRAEVFSVLSELFEIYF